MSCSPPVQSSLRNVVRAEAPDSAREKKNMNAVRKFALATLMAGSAAIAASPSNAAPPVLTHPPRGDQARPCRYFVHRHLPAPRHCYRFLSNIFGPEVYVHGGYVFRDRQAFLRWHERQAEPMGRLAEREA